MDMAIMEKEALAEELVNVKSRKTLDTLNRDEAVMSPTTGKVCTVLYTLTSMYYESILE